MSITSPRPTPGTTRSTPSALRRLPASPRRLLGAAASWPVTSQQRAQLNAQRSCSELARARRERLEVEEYLAGLGLSGLLARTSAAG